MQFASICINNESVFLFHLMVLVAFVLPRTSLGHFLTWRKKLNDSMKIDFSIHSFLCCVILFGLWLWLLYCVVSACHIMIHLDMCGKIAIYSLKVSVPSIHLGNCLSLYHDATLNSNLSRSRGVASSNKLACNPDLRSSKATQTPSLSQVCVFTLHGNEINIIL